MMINDKEFSQKLNEYVNNMCHSNNTVAEECRKHHRALQYEEVRFAMDLIKGLAKNYDENLFDGRNEFAVKACKVLSEYMDSDEFYAKVRALKS